MTGKQLSHYRIDAELGRGGMGIVYRATDLKLDRTVALKLLPVSTLINESDRSRFYREARAAASLHHPNIASVFEIDEVEPDGGGERRPFIAMEYVDGRPLDQVIADGPLKLADAVRIGTQIAEALKMAHANDVVHRDIKSANIMLTSDGQAKVLDFGLAKTAASTKLTTMGSTLGTIAYMSPEQARGEEVDARTDLYSLGTVLYEMLTGRLPFPGEYEQAVVYGILNEAPEPLTAVRTGVPMGLEWIVSKLLAKKPEDRYQNAGDLIVDLRTVDLESTTLSRVSNAAAHSRAPSAAADLTGSTASKKGKLPLFAGLAFAAGVALTGLVWFFAGASATTSGIPTGTPKKFEVDVPGSSLLAVDISPMGDRIVYVSDMIRVLDLRTGRIVEIHLDDSPVHVEVSPDGSSILLAHTTGLSTVSIDGGSILPVYQSTEGGPRGTWGPDGWIYFEDRNQIFGKSLTSGAVRQISSLDTLAGEFDHDFPHVMPDGRTLVATAEYGESVAARIGFWDIATGERIASLDYPGYRVQWAPSGHLVFEMNERIVALPFDADRLEPTGALIPVVENASAEGLSVALDGTLVHAGADVGIAQFTSRTVPLRIAVGNTVTDFGLAADYYRDLALSPNGEMAAVVIDDPATERHDVWILELDTGFRRRLTSDGNSDFPSWTPAGDSVLYVRKDRISQLLIRAANGSGTARVFAPHGGPSKADPVMKSDGSAVVMAMSITDEMVNSVLTTATRSGEQVDWLFAESGSARHPDLSPDDRYTAFDMNGSIFILPTDEPNREALSILTGGFSRPRWSHDGTKLFALASDGNPHALPITLDPEFRVTGSPAQQVNWAVAGVRLFDVFPDDASFMLPNPTFTEESSTQTADPAEDTITLHVIVNWFSELR
ncbi:MAG: serine/threonine-protein kinase [Rhodothermales bacterium]|nr:serine/threonine-protein kinase [Rhodothermales bacterium]